MKLRFRGNSLRLRLNQFEVAALAGGKPLEEHVKFPGSAALVYRLVPQTNGSQSDATFANSVITVSVPADTLRGWSKSEEIGVYYKADQLNIAIEKDLECVEEQPEERDPYAYPRKAAC